ncbi:Golgi apparatus membrane protein TVP38 [Crepidotus variabilis]|uniref:Golgi apparatus membrane protein TVP38 n=1 Tax=Crepidotus variabilis TaxID=179855 RepID=A0A9P6ETV1_9AGAR|nr:Golgi apparatus membrane protein TVP38 [Crepidotus variabilis]
MSASQRLTNLWSLMKGWAKYALNKYRNLHLFGKIFIWLVVLFYIFGGAFIVIATPARIAQYTYDKAEDLAALKYGWLILGCAIVIISFPPLVGHTTLSTLAGFAYGMKGFFISAVASIVGSALAFVVLRLLFKQRLRAWANQNEKWKALESVVRAKGLPLIILIRISPFPPWVYSNSLFASIQPVKLWQFVTATCFVLPKILLHTFIGSKIAELSDGEQRGHMDTRTKIIDAGLIVGGILIALFASWTVYNLVQDHIRKLEGFSPEVDALAAEAIEGYDEEAPLLSSNQERGD